MKLILVSGGAASGKSEYAENLMLQLGKGAGKTYLATMQRDGREAEERIARHTALRKGKGFSTVECSADITRVISACKEAVLLEDLSNLVANEMFGAGEKRLNPAMTREKDTAKRVAADVLQLAKYKELLVVVTNEIFSDGLFYPEETRQYIRILGRTNALLAESADAVVELVYGIPVWQKGKECLIR